MATEADEVEPINPPIPQKPGTHAEWSAVREAMTRIGVALESLDDEMQARVLACWAILTGNDGRMIDILNGNG